VRGEHAFNSKLTRKREPKSISRLWQEKSAALVEQLQDSDLSDFDLVILMLDAVVLTDGLVALYSRHYTFSINFHFPHPSNLVDAQLATLAPCDLPKTPQSNLRLPV